MGIIGFSSGVVGRDSNCDRMVKAVLAQSGMESEFIKLTDKTYSACKGCVGLCAKDRVCKLDDEIQTYYEKIKKADAVVLAAPVYFSSVNMGMQSFVERFFGYRHLKCAIAGKAFVVITSGGMPDKTAGQEFKEKLEQFFEVKVLSLINNSSKVPPCLSCGMHKSCRIGGLYHMMGEDAFELDVCPEMFNQWENNHDICKQIEEASELLKNL